MKVRVAHHASGSSIESHQVVVVGDPPVDPRSDQTRIDPRERRRRERERRIEGEGEVC